MLNVKTEINLKKIKLVQYDLRMVILFILFPICVQINVFAVDNPIIENVTDSGVLKYNGEYFLIGTRTSGNIYVSEDLIHWRGPIHVFSMQNDWTYGETSKDHQIHACDLNYDNGVFHLYWSVNHKGYPYTTRLIGHATSHQVLGPYDEPVKETWFDESIDAHLFIDDDYTSYFYSVKFSDGNAIWGRKLSNPWKQNGTPKMLLTANPMTWEWKDHKVIEGPFVIKYRDQYYMLYNANHTGARWGNYGIGCAVAEHPLCFNNATKYPHPVIKSNQERIEEHAVIIIPSARFGIHKWSYTKSLPQKDWNNINFDDSTWKRGEAGFGHSEIRNSSTQIIRQSWTSPDIWLRSKFKLKNIPSQFLQLQIAHHGWTEVYLNSIKIYEGKHLPYYALIDIVHEKDTFLYQGENILAIHSQKDLDSDTQYIDAGLIAPLTHPGLEFIFNPGQPNLVRGLNGFEWWLVYFAIFNSGLKSQAVDRVYFFDKELFIDGPTNQRSPGYHPNTAQPAFGDNFNREPLAGLGKRWHINDDSWSVVNGEAHQNDGKVYREAFIDCEMATHYLFEVNLKFSDSAGEKIGVIAYWADEDNNLKVFFDQKNKNWGFWSIESGHRRSSLVRLPEDFNYEAYHNLRVTKNSGTFEVRIDQRSFPRESLINTSFSLTGKLGIFTQNAQAAFDGVIYTIGWDEFDSNITGWSNSFTGTKSTGKWSTGGDGFIQMDCNGESKVFKGDLLPKYEFMSQLTVDSMQLDHNKEVRMGVYPVYIDPVNWMRAEIDMRKIQLLVYGQKDDLVLGPWSKKLSHNKRIYPTIVYTDRQTKTYEFNTPLQISEVEVIFDKYEESEKASSLRFFYRMNGRWKPITFTSHEEFEKGFYRYFVKFDTLVINALRIKEKQGDLLPRIESVYANIVSKPTYNLRAVKLNDRVLLFVDGKEMLNLNGEWPRSQVGLVTKNVSCKYNGITFFGF